MTRRCAGHAACFVGGRVDHGTVVSMFDLALLAPERLRPLRVREYDQLVAAGVFADEHVELLGGVLVAMSPQGDPHRVTTALIAMLLTRALDGTWFVQAHSPLRVSSSSKPEPDVAVMRRDDAHRQRSPVLVIEVSETSVVKDREIKRHFYAAAKIPEYWIVDLQRGVVEVRTRPLGRDYTRTRERAHGDVIRPLGLRGVAIAVSDFLPRPPTRRRRG